MNPAPGICQALGWLMMASLSAAHAAASGDATQYRPSAKIPGSGGAWDYAVVDPHGSRLYLAQDGVTALDLRSGKLTSHLITAKMTHGLAPLGDGTIAVDDAVT